MVGKKQQLKKLTIYIDNQVAIMSLKNSTKKPCSYFIKHIIKVIKQLHKKHKDLTIKIRWVPGHKGILGNEKADKGAKKAVRMGSSVEQELPKVLGRKLLINSTAVKQERMEEINKEARQCFEMSPRYQRQHKIDPRMPSNRYMKILTILNQN